MYLYKYSTSLHLLGGLSSDVHIVEIKFQKEYVTLNVKFFVIDDNKNF